MEKYFLFISRLYFDSGEIIYDVRDNLKLFVYKFLILIDFDGINVVLVNLYFYFLLVDLDIFFDKMI